MVSITHAKAAWEALMAFESAGDEPKDAAECRRVPVRESSDVDRRAVRGDRSCRSARGLSGPGPRSLAARRAGGKWALVQGQPNRPMHVPGGSDLGHERFEECRGIPVRESRDVDRRAERLAGLVWWPRVSQVPGLGLAMRALRAEMGFGSGSAEPSHARSRWVRPGPRAFRGMPRGSGQGIQRRRSACGAR